jgi:uncharacterized membrane protein YjjP (DUF1212 family)
MTALLWAAAGIIVLYIWLSGHWFGWALAFLAGLVGTLFYIKGEKTAFDLFTIGLAALICSGIPFLIRSGLMRRNQRAL